MEEIREIYQPERAETVRTQFLRIRNLFSRFWWVLALTCGLGVSYQAWQAITRPVSYVSYSKIIVSGSINLPDGSLMREDTLNFFGTQVQLMEGAEVRRRAIDRVRSLRSDLTPVPVSLSVTQIPRTAIFELSATGSQPDYVKAFLDAVMKEYIAVRKAMFSEKSQNTLSAITEQLLKLENELRRSEDELLEWQKVNNLVFLQEEGNSAGLYLATLNRKLALLQTDYTLLDQLTPDQNLDRAAEKTAAADIVGSDPTEAQSYLSLGGPSREYQQAKLELLLIQAELQQKRGNWKSHHHGIEEIELKIQEQQKKLEVLRAEAITQLRSNRESLGVQIANIQGQIADWEKKALDLSRRLGEFERLKGKVGRQKGLYDKLLANVQNVDVNSNIQQDIVSIMADASPPSHSVQPIAKDLCFGAVAGLVFGCGILFLIGMLDDRIVSISELQGVFDEELIGVIPKLPVGQQVLIQPEDDRQALVEAFRNIRSWFLFSTWEKAQPKTILITSALPEEGKTTVAANFAITLASSGARTLLVDADMRRGVLHKYFNVYSEPGLGELLTGKLPPEQAAVGTDIPNLFLIPKGHYAPHSNDIIFGKGIEHLIAKLSETYDYIVFDSCPVLAVDDTSTMAPKMDAVFLVVRSGFSRIRLTRKTLALLQARHATVNGLIYNSVDWAEGGYPYYRYDYREREGVDPEKTKIS